MWIKMWKTCELTVEETFTNKDLSRTGFLSFHPSVDEVEKTPFFPRRIHGSLHNRTAVFMRHRRIFPRSQHYY